MGVHNVLTRYHFSELEHHSEKSDFIVLPKTDSNGEDGVLPGNNEYGLKADTPVPHETDKQNSSAQEHEDPMRCELQRMYRKAYDHGLKEGLAKGRSNGHQDGFGQGKIDGEASGHNKGFQQGLADGVKQAEKTILLMEKIWEQLNHFQDQCFFQLGKELQKLCFIICKHVLFNEISVNENHLAILIKEAVRLVPEYQKAELTLNPGDNKRFSELNLSLPPEWIIVEDESITEGGCRIKLKHQEIDMQVESRLKNCFESIRRTMFAQKDEDPLIEEHIKSSKGE